MSKVMSAALIAGVLGVGTGWALRPPPPEIVPQQTMDSVWTKLAPGQGLGPTAVFSCSLAGAWGVTIIRHQEYADSAETAWGIGERVSFEEPENVCDCSAGFNELGPCRQGRWRTPIREP